MVARSPDEYIQIREKIKDAVAYLEKGMKSPQIGLKNMATVQKYLSDAKALLPATAPAVTDPTHADYLNAQDTIDTMGNRLKEFARYLAKSAADAPYSVVRSVNRGVSNEHIFFKQPGGPTNVIIQRTDDHIRGAEEAIAAAKTYISDLEKGVKKLGIGDANFSRYASQQTKRLDGLRQLLESEKGRQKDFVRRSQQRKQKAGSWWSYDRD